MAGCCLFEGTNFYFALACLCLKFLLSEGYMAPAISMLQRTTDKENQGSIVSVQLFFLTLASSFSTVLLGWLSNFFGASSNPLIYGKLIFWVSAVSYLSAIPFFYLAGKHYEAHLRAEKRMGL